MRSIGQLCEHSLRCFLFLSLPWTFVMLIFRDVPVSLHAGDMFWTFRSTINALCWFCFRVFSGQSLLHLIGLLGFVIWIALLCFAGITRLCTCRPFIYLMSEKLIRFRMAASKHARAGWWSGVFSDGARCHDSDVFANQLEQRWATYCSTCTCVSVICAGFSCELGVRSIFKIVQAQSDVLRTQWPRKVERGQGLSNSINRTSPHFTQSECVFVCADEIVALGGVMSCPCCQVRLWSSICVPTDFYLL